jgi:hypothetical protein
MSAPLDRTSSAKRRTDVKVRGPQVAATAVKLMLDAR